MTRPTPITPAPLTLGIVGFGKIARDQHVPAIAATGLFRLAAVVSPHGDPAEETGLGDVAVFRSQGEMLAALPGLDAVAICTPPAVRHVLTVEALRAGKHVLIEKPPAATLTELRLLLDAAEDAKRTLFAAWHSRFNAAVEETRRRAAPPSATLPSSGRRTCGAGIPARTGFSRREASASSIRASTPCRS
ncbi:Gfo/Idh/MocA family protein [Azospirillum brasilense]|uniref:Gfo/Idh/MocA family protein n=1 Tax=Azospirillum brasilense TaxID=192 RepID=UPI0003A94784|nr:Gfo/Idh/MocA family oxidoreductase [Azospirillum brasilense]